MDAVPKKIVWLASYPKSGNTWFRAFLTALMGDGELNINQMKTDGIFSSRDIFNSLTDLDSTYLYDEEIKVIQPEIFKEAARSYEKERLFIKIHDAYMLNKEAQPIVPTEPTQCALYFIRNPLDIVGSFANHNAATIGETIRLMNNPEGRLAKQLRNRNTNPQFRQVMLDWSGHVKSWTAKLPFPVMVIRYEDMLQDTSATFKKAVFFMGLKVPDSAILRAIDESSFVKLQEKEKKSGFNEKNKKSLTFFRSGNMGNWKNELTIEQIHSITSHHGAVMKTFNY